MKDNNKKEYHLCKITYEILTNAYKDGDIVIPFDDDKQHELSMSRHFAGDGYYFTKRHKSVKVYDGETGQFVPVVGFGVDSDKKHMEHTRKFVSGWQSSGLETPMDYLNNIIK